jgi:hypothetical protein
MSGSIQPANLLQPYCNLADTGGYALDKAIPPDLQKPPKQAQFPDTVGRAGTSASKLVVSRPGVRVPSSALYFTCKTYKKSRAHDHATGALAAVGQQ